MTPSGPPPVKDVVVVIPGIQGTKLVKDGKPVWAPSAGAFWQAIRTGGDNIKSLALPQDIGDEAPNDRVTPSGLMPDVHGIPKLGIGPFGGYSQLSAWLRNTMGLHPATESNP